MRKETMTLVIDMSQSECTVQTLETLGRDAFISRDVVMGIMQRCDKYKSAYEKNNTRIEELERELRQFRKDKEEAEYKKQEEQRKADREAQKVIQRELGEKALEEKELKTFHITMLVGNKTVEKTVEAHGYNLNSGMIRFHEFVDVTNVTEEGFCLGDRAVFVLPKENFVCVEEQD